MDRRKMTAYHILFSLAVVSVVLGAGLLFITTGRVSGPLVLWPLSLVAAGALSSYFAFTARLKGRFIFLSLFVTCAALIRFIATVLGISSADYWPLFAIAAGLCMLPAHNARYGRAKPSSIVISSAFIVLGLFFSIFSFGFSSMRFKTFITRWWPALFIASGVVLLVAWAIQRLVLKNMADPQAKGSADDGSGGTA
jgi:hypothetical protein